MRVNFAMWIIILLEGSATFHLYYPGGWEQVQIKNFQIQFHCMTSASCTREETNPCHCWHRVVWWYAVSVLLQTWCVIWHPRSSMLPSFADNGPKGVYWNAQMLWCKSVCNEFNSDAVQQSGCSCKRLERALLLPDVRWNLFDCLMTKLFLGTSGYNNPADGGLHLKWKCRQ